MFVLLQLNIIKAGFFFEYGIAHYLSNAIAACIMFDNRHFSLCLQHPMFILILIYMGKSQRYERKADNQNSQGILRWLYENTPFIVAFLSLIGDAIERLQLAGRRTDDVNFLYWDILMAKLKLTTVSFDNLLYLCNPELSFIDWDTLQGCNKLFFSKIFAIFIIVHLSKWLQYRRKKRQIANDDHIERSKNYLIEDFLEENKITMKDLVNPITDKQLSSCMEQLKACKYDYELYQKEKQKNVKSKSDERKAFLNDVKRFKEEIIHKNEAYSSKTNQKTEETENKETHESDSEINVKNETNNSDSVENEKDEINESKETDTKPMDINELIKPYYLYNLLQTGLFLLMTFFVVKLKYVLTPFLCLMASTFPPKNWFNKAYHLYWIFYTLSIVFSIADPGIQVSFGFL